MTQVYSGNKPACPKRSREATRVPERAFQMQVSRIRL